MKRKHGPSLYYATDKNVFDALNQHKVDMPTVLKLFERRNIVVSSKTPRDVLARYFARLTHDYFDHQNIAARLGISPRRERTTSIDIAGIPSDSDKDEKLREVIDKIKGQIESDGSILHIKRSESTVYLEIQYSVIDYKRTEFTQVQHRDGVIEWSQSADGFTIRNTQNEFINNIRDEMLTNLEASIGAKLIRKEVSLFDVPSYAERSKFFLDLMSDLPGFSRKDVTDVYVYKPKPDASDDDEDEDGASSEEDAHVERVFLRGNGVSRSEILGSLDKKGYYIVKAGWRASKILGQGEEYDLEATFADPKDCTGFSFVVRGVYPIIDGKLSSNRRSANIAEGAEMARVIERKALELATTIRTKHAANGTPKT
ncbi:hypothetical protein [Dyella sp. SG609]|uniref:hypothetical protein n=1 Tax=Dyella sp. SG609 TaxID=2587018 RepID=UPI00183F96F3|nr:hypothetical protein [Dyella sp. SG609]NKJ23852.1 hypothetical protein [Dyella sp. SG609]